jgi:hypothetical protein
MFFAHEGHEHVPEPGFFETMPGIVVVNVVPFLLLGLLLLLMSKVLRLDTRWQVAMALLYLLAVGLLGYRYVPIASTISLVAGFGLSLAFVVLPFKKA